MSKGYWKTLPGEQFDTDGEPCPVCQTGTLEVYITQDTVLRDGCDSDFMVLKDQACLRCSNDDCRFVSCSKAQSAWNKLLEDKFFNGKPT